MPETINLKLPDEQNRLLDGTRKKAKRKRFIRTILIFFVIILVIAGAISWKLYNVSGKIFNSNFSFFDQASRLLSGTPEAPLLGEENDQVNILLLGYGGEGHDGAYLTDSILLASIRPKAQKIILTAIPRDYYYPSDISVKVNAVFASAFYSKKTVTLEDLEAGGLAAETAIAKISGKDVPYFVSIDFEGFVDAVNQVKGLDIMVEKSFTDYSYPNGDKNVAGPYCMAKPGNNDSPCRYIEVHFDAGPQTMDGLAASQFVRSRHASGSEGSDFARGKRQQLVLEAFKQKLEKLNILSNATAINNLINILADHLHTNLTLSQTKRLSQLIRQKGMETVSQSLDPASGLVCLAKLPPDGASVVKPCSGIKEGQIAQFFQNGYETLPIRKEEAVIILENNGASEVGYDEIKKELLDLGIRIFESRYHGEETATSTLYAINDVPATKAYLEKRLNLTSQPLPQGLKAKADLVLIISKDF